MWKKDGRKKGEGEGKILFEIDENSYFVKTLQFFFVCIYFLNIVYNYR